MALPASVTIPREAGFSRDVTLAATEVNLRNPGDQRYLSEALMYSKIGALRAWKHYERLGVIRYPLNRAARIAGSATLHAVDLDESGNVVGPVELNATDEKSKIAVEEAAAIYSRFGGVRGLIERYFLLMKVPADSWLIRVKEGSAYDGYMFLSSSEMANSTDGYDPNPGIGDLKWVTAPGGHNWPTRERNIARKDVLGRVWTPSPRFIDLPDSPLYTLADDCDLLYRLNIVLRAQMRSRAIMSGIAFFPDTLSQMATTNKDGVVTKDQMIKKLREIWKSNTELAENGDAADIAHILLMGPGDAGEQIKEIVFGRETQDGDMRLRAELTENILFTLDIHQKQTKGESDTLRGAWTASSEELRLAVIPDIEAMCWALTRIAYRKRLIGRGFTAAEANRKAIWYDLSRAAIRISRQEDTRQLTDRLGANLKALRKVSGLEETDAPTEEEYVRQLGVLTKDPYLATFGMDIADTIDWDMVGKPPGKPQDSQGDDPDFGPGTKDPGNPDQTDPDAEQPEEMQ